MQASDLDVLAGCFLIPSFNMSMDAPKSEWKGPAIRVGVIGGSGLYKLEGIEVVDVVRPLTVCS